MPVPVPVPAATTAAEATFAACVFDVAELTAPAPPGLILPFRICWKGAVLIFAATTTPFPFMVCWTRLVMLTLKIVEQPNDGTGPKLVANRLAKKVKRLFATAGAGEVVPVNKAWFWAMKSADAAYCWQYVVPDASAAVAA